LFYPSSRSSAARKYRTNTECPLFFRKQAAEGRFGKMFKRVVQVLAKFTVRAPYAGSAVVEVTRPDVDSRRACKCRPVRIRAPEERGQLGLKVPGHLSDSSRMEQRSTALQVRSGRDAQHPPVERTLPDSCSEELAFERTYGPRGTSFSLTRFRFDAGLSS